MASNEFCIWAVSSPVTEQEAADALRRVIPDFDQALAAGKIEILKGTDWYLKEDRFDFQRIARDGREKLESALARGHDDMRVSGNAFWMQTAHWNV